jgi:hypothetical protein
MHRVNYSKDKRLAKIGEQLIKGIDIFEKNKCSVEDAIAIKHDLDLSKESEKKLRRFVSRHNVRQ